MILSKVDKRIISPKELILKIKKLSEKIVTGALCVLLFACGGGNVAEANPGKYDQVIFTKRCFNDVKNCLAVKLSADLAKAGKTEKSIAEGVENFKADYEKKMYSYDNQKLKPNQYLESGLKVGFEVLSATVNAYTNGIGGGITNALLQEGKKYLFEHVNSPEVASDTRYIKDKQQQMVHLVGKIAESLVKDRASNEYVKAQTNKHSALSLKYDPTLPEDVACLSDNSDACLTQDMKEVINLIEQLQSNQINQEQFSELIVGEMSKLMNGSFEDTQALIRSSNNEVITSMEERESARLVAINEQKKKQLIDGDRYAMVGIVGMALDLVDPRLSNQVTTIGNAALQINSALNTLGDLDSLFAAGSAMATGNIFGAVTSVISLFGPSQPTADEIILEQLHELGEQIGSLRLEMHSRFDVVDEKLDQLLLETSVSFSEVNGKLDLNLNRLKNLANVIHSTQRLIVEGHSNIIDIIENFNVAYCNAAVADEIWEIETVKFQECIAKLGLIATDYLELRQTGIEGLDDTSLAIALDIESNTSFSNAVYELFKEKNDYYDGNDRALVNVSLLYNAISEYVNFITSYPELSRDYFQESVIKKVLGKLLVIKQYRQAVLDSFSQNDNNPLRDHIEYGENLINLWGYVYESIFLEYGFSVVTQSELPFILEELDVSNVKLEVVLENSPYVNTDGELISEEAKIVLLSKVPRQYLSLVAIGVGKLTLTNKYTGVIQEEGLQILGNKFYASLRFDTNVDAFESVTLATMPYHYHIDEVIYPNGLYSEDVYFEDTGLTLPGPFFYNAEKAGESIIEAIANWNPTGDALNPEEIQSIWQDLHSDMTSSLLSMVEQHATEEDGAIKLQNAYVAALFRDVFSESLGSSSIANNVIQGEFGYPTFLSATAEDLDSMSLWQKRVEVDRILTLIDGTLSDSEFKADLLVAKGHHLISRMEIDIERLNAYFTSPANDHVDSAISVIAATPKTIVNNEVQSDVVMANFTLKGKKGYSLENLTVSATGTGDDTAVSSIQLYDTSDILSVLDPGVLIGTGKFNEDNGSITFYFDSVKFETDTLNLSLVYTF